EGGGEDPLPDALVHLPGDLHRPARAGRLPDGQRALQDAVRGERMRATHRRGAAATELALFLPFLALLFFVAVDYARAFRAAQVIDGCARTGALYASGA